MEALPRLVMALEQSGFLTDHLALPRNWPHHQRQPEEELVRVTTGSIQCDNCIFMKLFILDHFW
jgi:hypothetical protein